MTIVISKLRAFSVYEQANASFATDHSTAPNDYLPIPVVDGYTLTLDNPEKDPNTVQQYKHAISERVFGPKRATFNFEMSLAPTGTIATASQQSVGPSGSVLYRLLDIVMGGSRTGIAGSDVVSGTAGAFAVTTGHGTRFSAGGAFGWVNAAGELEIHEIASVSTNTITPKIALSASPTAGDDIIQCSTFYLDDGDSSAQFLVEGSENSDEWSIIGAQGGFTLTSVMGEIPRIGFQFSAAHWVSLGSASLTAKTYSNHEPLVFTAGKMWIQEVGTRTFQLVDVQSVTITPAITYGEIASPQGKNGIKRWIQQHGNPVVSGEIVVYFEDVSWFTARDNKTRYHIALQINVSDQRGVMIAVPNAQITNVSAPQDSAGIMTSTISFVGDIDSDATDQSTALRRSALRMHFAG